MSNQQSNEALRKEVLDDDKKRDVDVRLGVTVATLSAASGMFAAGAIIVLRALGTYRSDIGGYWMSCIPFCFPALTGIGVAFKREFAAVATHLTVVFFAFLAGGSSYGYSVSPIYEDRVNCTEAVLPGDCEKPVLVHLYLVFGGIASGSCFLTLMITLCTFNTTRKRVAKRRHEAELRAQQEGAELEYEEMKAKKAMFEKPRMIPAANAEAPPTGNGIQTKEGHVNHAIVSDSDYTQIDDTSIGYDMKPNGGYINQVALSDNLTTKL